MFFWARSSNFSFALSFQRRLIFEDLTSFLYNFGIVNRGLYYFEPITEHMTRTIKVDQVFFQKRTKYQFVECFYNKFFGKLLFVDNKIQSAQIDEFVYHESLVHPALITHPRPRKILIMGGGEGATLREALRHNCIERATMVDIDKELVELCGRHLPEWSDGAFSSPKASLVFGDGRRFVEKSRKKFDIIISDLTEPLEEGPAVYLFTKEFFWKVFETLNEDGMFVCQAGSTDPYSHQFFGSLTKTLEHVFPLVRPYWTFLMSFGQPWGFVLASRRHDPLALDEKEIRRRIVGREIEKLRHYHPGLHRSAFALPLYLKKDLRKGKILTDKRPFVWTV